MGVNYEISFRERTQEFIAIADRMKKHMNPTSNDLSIIATKCDGFQSLVSIQSEFNKKSSEIGIGIQQTSKKISKLTIRKKIRQFS